MQNKIDVYLYYKGEEKNPYLNAEGFEKNKHMWWGYEQHFFHSKEAKIQHKSLLNFIKYILENKVDYGDRDNSLLNQYLENGNK